MNIDPDENQDKPNKQNFVIFKASLKSILNAINNKSLVEGIDIHAELQNSAFSFACEDNLELSSLMSTTFKSVVDFTRQQAIKSIHQHRVAPTVTAADKYAIEMVPVIEKLKSDNGVKSFAETVKMLNSQGIQSFRGSKWHVRTLHALYMRNTKLHEIDILQSVDISKSNAHPDKLGM